MFEYTLPDVGEGVAEGEIVAWHVEPGDEVTEDQVLAEVETDKAVVDLPAPVDGVIVELHADPGEVVAVGSVVVTIDTGEDTDSTATEASTADESTESSGDKLTESAEKDESVEATKSVFAPPHVRRLARELGVDIETVDGSDSSGRITESDVREAVERKDAETDDSDERTARKSAVSRRSESDSNDKPATRRREPAAERLQRADRDRTLAAPATRKLAEELGVDLDAVPTETTRNGEAFVESDDVRAYAERQQKPANATEVTSSTPVTADDSVAVDTEERTGGEVVRSEPYRGVRRTIGQRMSQSAFTAPHVTHHDTAVVPELVEARTELNSHAEKRGANLTYLPFVMKAVVAALPEYPPLNAELDDENEEIRYHGRYDIGVAVATDAGLMVPVVERVDQKGLVALAKEVTDLVERARERELTPEELRGSTFTITNFGAIGGEYATPILNYPETGILGLGKLEERPVVEDGDVVARYTLPLSLSIDHRVVDGAEAAGFCNELKTYLENPTALLL